MSEEIKKEMKHKKKLIEDDDIQEESGSKNVATKEEIEKYLYKEE